MRGEEKLKAFFAEEKEFLNINSQAKTGIWDSVAWLSWLSDKSKQHPKYHIEGRLLIQAVNKKTCKKNWRFVLTSGTNTA